MNQEFISPQKFIRLAWKYSHEERIKALANYEDRNLEIPMPPLPSYMPVESPKWGKVASYAFLRGLLP